MRYFTATLLFILISLVPRAGMAQQTDLGSWWLYSGYNKIHDHWSVFTEVQYRSFNLGKDVLQLLFRPGLNYHLTDKSSVGLGYTHVNTYIIESDINSPIAEEHAIWQQLMHRHAIPHLKFEHRFRAEQRFINDLSNINSNIYKNRFRYRLLLTVPLGKETIEPNTLFIGVFDELFLQTGDTWFEHNRLYGALGYQFTTSTNFQLGIMNQAFKKIDKWYLMVALTWNPDLRKSN